MNNESRSSNKGQSKWMTHVLHSRNGYLTGANPPSDLDQVARLVDLSWPSANGMVVYVHGGLVPLSDALQRAEELYHLFDEELEACPVFFAWESGPLGNFTNNIGPALSSVLNGVSNAVFGERNRSRGRVRRLEEMSVLDASSDNGDDEDRVLLQERFTARLSRDEKLLAGVATLTGTSSAAIRRLRTVELDETTHVDYERIEPETYAALFGARAGDAARRLETIDSPDILDRLVAFSMGVYDEVREREKAHRLHGVRQSIMEEVIRQARVGGAAWLNMKEDAEALASSNPLACGTALVNAIRDKEASSGGTLRKLTLIGHSAGSIAICALIEVIARLKIQSPVEIIFLAPAVSYERFGTALRAIDGLPAVRRFRMFTMNDRLERRDKVKFGPFFKFDHSLLYLVSGSFETRRSEFAPRVRADTPILGMRRFRTVVAKDPDVLSIEEQAWIGEVEQFLSRFEQATVFSETADAALPGQRTRAKSHGGFVLQPDTLESVIQLIREP